MDHFRNIVVFLFLVGGIYFFADKQAPNESTKEQVLEAALALESPTSIDNSLELLDDQHASALSGFSDLEQAAKSKAAVQFVAATRRQNELAAEMRESIANMADGFRFLESFNWDTDVKAELQLLESNLVALCPQIDNYITQGSRLIAILDEKVRLTDHPDVISEVFEGDAAWSETLKQFRESQNRIVEREKLAYLSFCVSE